MIQVTSIIANNDNKLSGKKSSECSQLKMLFLNNINLGLADFEASFYLKKPIHLVAARRNDLINLGINITDSGIKRVNPLTRKSGIVWKISNEPAAKKELKKHIDNDCILIHKNLLTPLNVSLYVGKQVNTIRRHDVKFLNYQILNFINEITKPVV